jgi:FkbM family methyltransferase
LEEFDRIDMSTNNESNLKIKIVKILIYIGQKTILGRGQLRKQLINLINFLIGHGSVRTPRFICNVNNVPFNFYNDKLTFIKIYFGRSNLEEIDFIKKNSPNKSVFVDIGSNMGFYTQFIANMITKKRKIKIISIDAHPTNNFRLQENLKLLKYKIPNIFSYVKIKNCAVGDRNTKLNLDFSNGFANGFISKNKKNISIKCRKLTDIIKQEKLNYVTNLKIDIEGYEDKVLISYLKKCKKNLIPKNIILEHSEQKQWNVDLLQFLFKFGYREVFKNRSNIILNFNK